MRSTILRNSSIRLLPILALGLGSILVPGFTRAQESADPIEAAVESPSPEATSAALAEAENLVAELPDAAADERAREASLVDVLAARQRLEHDLRALQDELRSDRARGREAEIENEIRRLAKAQFELERSFAELASGMDPVSIVSTEAPAELDLGGDVRDLLSPLINEVKRATSRPREIDRLRTEIAQLEERLQQIANARERVASLRTRVQDANVLEALASEEENWDRRASTLGTALKVAQQKLDQRLSESQSIGDTIGNVFQIFFKSRGRNLLIALLATFAFLYGLRGLRALVAKRPGFSSRSPTLRGRIFGLMYSAFTGVGALLVFLLALYLFGDWVLLILAVLLIFGVLWTSKQAIPRFWGQMVLLLDMGPVREGERVTHAGLPWRVDSISFYSDLTNPALAGGEIRLPIDDLRQMRSRVFREDEPWFPTQAGDVILHSSGRPAEVEFQSIDVVRLRTQGNNRLTIPTPDFISQTVERLSDGYRAFIQFGLDYGDQAKITTTMVEILDREVAARWRASRWADSLVHSLVEFASAGASSLDLFVRVDLDGRFAIDLEAQQRFLARICVDVCNEQGWTIPFTQITLHVAGNQTALPTQPAES